MLRMYSMYQKASVGVHFILLYLFKERKKRKKKKRNKIPQEKKKKRVEKKKKNATKIELFSCIVLFSIKGWRKIGKLFRV